MTANELVKKGTREMNNEPVAWMLNGIVHEFDPSDWSKERYPDQAVIPLYTHPIRELTDEEIRQVIDEHWEKTSNVNLFDFARTILKKAQEK
jgi:predicted hydrolase (HD superfamily)